MKKLFLFVAFGFSIFLMGCVSQQQKIRGVPVAKWRQLTPNQKQIIIDQSFDQFMKDNTKCSDRSSKTTKSQS